MCVAAPLRTAMPARKRIGSATRVASVFGVVRVRAGVGLRSEPSAQDVTDEQLPRGVYRDENGKF